MEQYLTLVVLSGRIESKPAPRNDGVLFVNKEDYGPGTIKAFCVEKTEGEKPKIKIIASSTVREENQDTFDDIDFFMVEISSEVGTSYFMVSSDCVNIVNGNLTIVVPDLADDDFADFYKALENKEEEQTIKISVIGTILSDEEEEDDDFFAGILNSDDDDEDDEEDQEPITDEDLTPDSGDEDEDEPDPQVQLDEESEPEVEVKLPNLEHVEESEEDMKIQSKIIDSPAEEEGLFIKGKQSIRDESVEQPVQKPLFKEVRIVDEGDKPQVKKDNNRKDFNKNKPRNNPGYVPNKSTIKDNSFKGNKPKPKDDPPSNLPSTKGTNRFGGW